jgi:hypothetical protein
MSKIISSKIKFRQLSGGGNPEEFSTGTGSIIHGRRMHREHGGKYGTVFSFLID